MERWFWFDDTPVEMHFETEQLYATVAPMLADLDHETPLAPRFSFDFRSSRVLHETDSALLVHEGPLGVGLSANAQYFRDGQKEWLRVEGTGSAKIDSLAKTASVYITPDARSQAAASTIALYAIDAALSVNRQYLLHGAALELPSNDGAALIFAPSGSGKTTTALALALHGFGIITDDALVLQRRETAVSVWGLPRPMKVHRHTADLLPALKSVVGSRWNDEDEEILTRRAFSDIGTLFSGRRAQVRVIFVLGKRTLGPHAIQSMPKADGFLALARDNLRTSRRGVSVRDVQKMEAIAVLLNSTNIAILRVGSKIHTLGKDIVRYCRGSEPSKSPAAV
jgi:hypothetical protein